MNTVFVDESGYTGADLLNTDQQFHTVAAVRLSAERAQDIVSRHLGHVAAAELKLASLVRRPRHRDALTKALHEVAQDNGAVGYVFCKRYALWLKLLDDCVEPIHHRHGVPFYENGANRALASLLLFTAGPFWGEERATSILRAYQNAARSQTKDSVQLLIAALKAIRGCEMSELFIPAMRGDPDVVASLLHPEGTLDLSYSLAVGIITWLETHTVQPYHLIHDRNKAVGASIPLLDAVTGIREAHSFRLSAHTELQYPLRCQSVGMADSRSDVRLQLADMFAGSVRLCAETLRNLKPDTGFTKQFLDGLPSDAVIFNLPTLDFDGTRKTFEGTDGRHIDFLAKHLARRGSRPM